MNKHGHVKHLKRSLTKNNKVRFKYFLKHIFGNIWKKVAAELKNSKKCTPY